MDQKENLNDQDLNLTVVLPGGVEKTATVPGSKPMMDLLVVLCAKYHLNPSSHTIELISTNRNHIKFKPNALIGTLEAEKILLKPKGAEEKSKTTGPQMPEATVRLVINYKKTQKTVLRVNPRVPLEEIMPAVCEKCEFDQKTSVLLRDVRSEEPLDLTKSLNDFGLREVYARDTKSVNSPELPSSPIYEGDRSPSFKSRSFKEKENKGLFGMFRRSKKKPDQVVTTSAPTSPVLTKPRPMSMPLIGASASVYNSNTTLSDVPKKRRAPLPPTMVLQRSMSNTTEHQTNSVPEGDRGFSVLRRTSSKRKAPPPPSSPSAIAKQDEALGDGSITAGSAPHSPLEEISEQEEMMVSATPDPSAATDVQANNGSPNASTDVPMDSGITEPAPPPTGPGTEHLPAPPDGTGEDQSNDLSSDGKPAKDPVSDKECTEQALNSVETELEHKDSAGTDLSPPAKVELAVHLEENASALGDDKEKSDSEGRMAQTAPEITVPPVPRPLTQDAETLTSHEQSGEAPGGHLLKATSAVDGPSSPAGDISPARPAAPSLARQEAASPARSPRPKRDMATSTEELPQAQAPPTLPQEPNSSPIYLLDYAPKPKPSNELTREYIPKVGLTTYTIVPQKSLEKLRFYEVELTLEPPGSVPGQMVAVGPQHCLAGIPAEQLELRSPPLRVGSPVSNGRIASRIDVPPTQPASPPAGNKPLSPRSWASPAPAMEQKKVPPPTKPKPGSFRLSMHKRTPGYVTSAAVKSANASHASRRTSVPGSPEAVGQPARALEEDGFPPPPPPVYWPGVGEPGRDEPKSWGEKPTAALASGLPNPAAHLEGPAPRPNDFTPNTNVPAPRPAETVPNSSAPPLSASGPTPNSNVPPLDASGPTPNSNVPPLDASGSTPRLTRQYSLPSRDPAVSLERLRGFLAPKPYAPATQSRFAKAVSSAIKRSHSFTKGSTADPQPHKGLTASPPANQHTIKELVEPSRNQERETCEGEASKTPQPEEQPDCGTGGATPSKTPGESERGATPDAPVDAVSPERAENSSPAVPDALPSLSLNGGPTEI